MSASNFSALAVGFLWLLATLLPMSANEHGLVEASGRTETSAVAAFPGWTQLVVSDRALQRVAGRSGSAAEESPGSARLGSTSTDAPQANPAAAALEHAGLGPVASRDRATVALSTIDGVERVGLDVARERLIPRDPRRDAYIETAPALFDAWSGELDPVQDSPDAEVVFFPEASSEHVEAAMSGAGFASDEWDLFHAREESPDDNTETTLLFVLGVSLGGVVVLAAAILLLRRKAGFARVLGLVLLLGVGLLAWRIVQQEGLEDRSEATGRQWHVVSVTADAQTVDRPEDPFEAAEVDFEAAQNPDIAHFGILVSHLAYQEAFAFGREFLPPGKGEMVHAPEFPSGNVNDRDPRIVFDE